MINDFRIAIFNITLKAGTKGLILPGYKGSTLRGGLGTAFQQLVCSQKRKVCLECLLKNSCPYAYVFATVLPPGATVLTKYQSVPRPFVIEPPAESRAVYQAGELLQFRLLLFGKGIKYFPYFVISFHALGELGIGKDRNPFTLNGITAVDPYSGKEIEVYNHQSDRVAGDYPVVGGTAIASRANDYAATEAIKVEYLTFTRLKFGDRFSHRVDFHILMRNLLRRLSSLAYFHHGFELELNLKGLLEQAEKITTVSDQTTWQEWERYSSRQDKKIPLGGLKGKVCYRGDFSLFFSLLLLGELTHIGKGTVYGMGKYQIASM